MREDYARSIVFPTTCAALAATVGVVVTLTATAGARDILRGSGSSSTTSVSTSSNSASNAASAQTAAAAERAKDTLSRATKALQAVQAAQSAARTAAKAAASTVPNGLQAGGLVPDSGAAADVLKNASDRTVWVGAGLPVETVSGGNVTVTITQSEQQAILNWQSFNIGKETALVFDQSAGGKNVGNWIVFNKVNDASSAPSKILGSIQASGQVYVINRNGIIFGGSSLVNTHALVASSLPINDSLISSGILNNSSYQFLFDGSSVICGDVVVEAGAELISPTSSDNVGGKVVLVGPNVTNAGTISTPDGQTILAAGLQVGFAAHSSADSSLRGLDVFVGTGGGVVQNSEVGLIDSPRASVVMTGKTVNQLGVIYSTTSVSLNGRIDLLADYDCRPQMASASGLAFLPQSTGVVTLGAGSVTEILPEVSSAETQATSTLTLTSLVNVQGRAIYMGANSLLWAPGATLPKSFTAYDMFGSSLKAGVTMSVGEWNLVTSSSPYIDTFVNSGGQIYLDEGASINVAGLTDVAVSVTQNLISAELLGTELADSVVQRTGVLRGTTITVDANDSGTYDGTAWKGTPLADVSGYINLIERNVAQLSINGGSISLKAGESVVLKKGSVLDVSGGWISYQGGIVKTTRLLSGGNIYDMSEATPDIVYSGVYSGFRESHSRWGVSSTYTSALLNGSHYEQGYIQGGDGGSVSITSLAMVLDGAFYGNTVTGERQRTSIPTSSSLNLTFEAQKEISSGYYISVSPAQAAAIDQGLSNLSIEPRVVIAEDSDLKAADAFSLDASGEPVALRDDRRTDVFFSSDIINKNGFGNVSIDNSDGSIVIPESTVLEANAGGSLSLKGANITVDGKITIAGGSMSFTVYDYSPRVRAAELDTAPTPAANVARGNFVLGSNAILDASGTIVDDRVGAENAGTLPIASAGGSVTIKSYNVDLAEGSVIDVSGGVRISETGAASYGAGGSIAIEAGRDPNINALVGGNLHLGATLLGYGGVKKVSVPYVLSNATIAGASLTVWEGSGGGSLNILAPLIQIGGTGTGDEDTLYLDSSFFNQGGFSSFTLSGLGKAVTDASGAMVTDPVTGEYVYTAAVKIAAGTTVAPTVLNRVAVLGEAGHARFESVELPESLRSPVKLSFKALGIKDSSKAVSLVARGDLVLEDGATIDAGLQGSVTLSGQTVNVQGSVYAPGGSITISGATASNSYFKNSSQALATVVIGSDAILDVSGALVLIPDTRGYNTGAVLSGGSISVSGNIVASSGAVLDVSGASGWLDLPGSYLGLPTNASGISVYSSLVESSAGTITLTGGQELYSDATLLGNAGGTSAEGGTLIVSSGYFDTVQSATLPAALIPTLVITQSGAEIASSYYADGAIKVGAAISDSSTVTDINGNAIKGIGHFTADSFAAGGFDSLELNGTLLFKGDVDLSTRTSLKIADGGVIFGTSSIKLSSAYISIGGSVLRSPKTETEYLSDYSTRNANGQLYSPTYGTGVLTVSASLIDVGDLSLRNIGSANFIADNGDIRGSGTLDVAGDIYLQAGQIYPPTATSFTIAAYDHDGVQGSVTIARSGERATPLSAGGEINIYASIINQGGVLRAPFGTINLGWNGVNSAPVDAVTGQSVDLITGKAYDATETVALLAGSITSVSGDGLTIPYGININGTQWIDPSGTDITTSGPPEKTVNISGTKIDSESGAKVDLSGGGDLYAYTFTSGTGGSSDVLLSKNSFAIIPGYASKYADVSSYNASATDYFGTDTGYANSSLKTGETIYLSGIDGLAAGYYTLLPARYALLSGAYLVTAKSGIPTASTVACSDGSYITSGYLANSFSSVSTSGRVYSSFEVASSSVVRSRALYTDSFANKFFASEAKSNSTTTPRLPTDAGRLVLSAIESLAWTGSIVATVPSGARGSLVDISSSSDILISGVETAAGAGTLVLTTTTLNSINADSLLIGGLRNSNGGAITVTAESITVDNGGNPLIGKDIILAASGDLKLAAGAEIEQQGSTAGALETISVKGDGAILRLSADSSVGVSRSSVPSTSAASLSIGDGVKLSGVGLTLDSANAMSLDPRAVLDCTAISVHSGQISLEFAGQGLEDLKTTGGAVTSGLVISGDALNSLMASAKSLSLLSYSSIDIYGEGQIGNSTYSSLSFQAAEIRAFNQGNVTFTAQQIALGNSADATAPTAVDGYSPALSGNLSFVAQTIQLGANPLTVSNYQTVSMNASSTFLATGAGVFYTQGDLSISSPLVTSAKAANETISTAGALHINAMAGSGDTSIGGLGGTLVFSGKTVGVDSNIWLPSGSLTLHATEGDVTVNGSLDAGGTYKSFYDMVQYTNGGAITLTADYGSVILGAGSKVNVAAQSGAGDAGSLKIGAANGAFSAGGTLLGNAGAGGEGGTFSLDVKSLPSTAWIDTLLNENGFTLSRTYRARTGDVAIDGDAQAATYRLSADAGGITVSSMIDSSGDEGGTIFLAAHGSLALKSGAVLTVAAKDFNSAGKGGAVTLEAGDSSLDSSGHYTHDTSAVLDIQTGSKIDLSVASATASSTSLGDFTGTLHLRAPQNSAATDLQLNPINGEIVDASVIIVEGYKVYTPVGGSIDSVESQIQSNGNTFVGVAGSKSAGYDAMLNRLVQNNQGIRSLVSIRPGAEIVNANGSSSSMVINLNSANSTVTVPTETAITFPNGTPGTDKITTSVNGTITYADGTTAAIVAGVATSLPAGASIEFSNSVGSGMITFKSGSTSIPVLLPSSSLFTTAGSTSITASGEAYTVQLGKTSSNISVASGLSLAFPNGTPGDDKITASVSGTIVLADGTKKTLAANTATALAAGSSIILSSKGTITFASGTTGGAIPITLPSSGSFTLAGTTYISTGLGDLTLGTTTSTSVSDLNLSTYRFGPDSAPGILTLRAAGNIYLYNSISDGFASASYSAKLLAANSLLPANAQSWSYRIVSGGDLTGVDFSDMESLDDLDEGSGSIMLGKYSTGIASSPGYNASTSNTLSGYYQVIRTGSGDIEVYAGRSVKLRNQFATIYTAGTVLSTPTTVWTSGDFDVPKQTMVGSSTDPLGAIQQSTPYLAQYSMGGGDVVIVAQEDIKHETVNRSGSIIDDSERELPTNWLYRRGYVDSSTELFGTSKFKEIASTTWWVDFSNFFEGIGALGGGNVTLIAGHDIVNVDAVIPTNARMPKGTPDASKLLELGGGDLVVKAGHDINGGVYYVERGNGVLVAGNSILTNATRVPSSAAVVSSPDQVDPATSESWLPTTLFLGSGSFDVSAVSDLLLGPVANTFLLPQGYNNTYWYKTYFSTYGTSDEVTVTSLTGNVTLRESVSVTNYSNTNVGSAAMPILEAWYDGVLKYSTDSASYYQPWLRLSESDVTAFATAASLMPGALKVTAYNGDINVVGAINLSPSPTGTLDLIAEGSVNGLNINGRSVVNGVVINDWGTGSINLSDANPSAIPGVATPFAFQELVGIASSARVSTSGFLDSVLNCFFSESGSTEGTYGTLETRQQLHDSGILHSADAEPVHVYAETGDISGLTLFSSKSAQVVAGNDITDIALYIQNVRESDVSLVSAGRNIIAYDAASPARQTISANAAYNQLNSTDIYPLSGDIQISGPGTLEILTGHNLDLGAANANPIALSDIGLGITSIGNARNPYLPDEGADIVIATGLNKSSANFSQFIDQFINPATSGGNAGIYLPEIATYLDEVLSRSDLVDASAGEIWNVFSALPEARKESITLRLFYKVIRDAGRNYKDSTNPGYQYKSAYAAIKALFPGSDWSGDVLLSAREIKTLAGVGGVTSAGDSYFTGGNISILAPGGGVVVGYNNTTGQALDQGIITQRGGQISIFAKESVGVGTSRIFTLRGGDIVIWSTEGNIAAGSSSKTVKSAPPTRVLVDPQSANVETDLAGLATGGGIGVLATVKDVVAGSVDLVAPLGVIDAGDAGIRATGNLYVAALQILNAGNIQAGGVSVGVPVAAAAPNLAALTAASNTVGAAMNSSENATNMANAQQSAMPQDQTPSIIVVEVLGYGGDQDE